MLQYYPNKKCHPYTARAHRPSTFPHARRQSHDPPGIGRSGPERRPSPTRSKNALQSSLCHANRVRDTLPQIKCVEVTCRATLQEMTIKRPRTWRTSEHTHTHTQITTTRFSIVALRLADGNVPQHATRRSKEQRGHKPIHATRRSLPNTGRHPRPFNQTCLGRHRGAIPPGGLGDSKGPSGDPTRRLATCCMRTRA